MDIQKEREAFKKEFGIDDADTFPAFSGGIENSAALKCNWLGWKKRAELEYKENPETIEIDGLKTIHKLCKFADDQNMEGCTFTEIVERMFDELAKVKTVPEWTEYEMKSPRIDGRYQIFIDGEQIAADWECGFGFSCPISGEALIQQKITHWSVLGGDPKEPANEL